MGYDNAPAAASLARVGGLAKALVILVGISGVAAVLSALLSGAVRDDARAFLDETNPFSEADFNSSYALAVTVGGIQFVTMIAAAVLTMIVMYRLARNHRSLGRRGTWAPGWGIGGWFVPPQILYIVPLLMFRELWKASDPTSPRDTEGWKSHSTNPMVFAWWVLYGLAVPITTIAATGVSTDGFTNSARSAAESIDERYPLMLLSGGLTLLAAIAFIVMIRGLVARHRKLTGES